MWSLRATWPEKVNAEIQERVDAHLAQAQADWDDYKDAFLATGGTEEEWADREMNVLIDYEIKSQTDTTVSFVVDFAEGWVAAMQQRYCYNLDLANDKDITLADVLGEDWVGICNDAVNAKIAADESGLFFTPEQGGFTTVDDATSFYLNEDGSVTLVFPEYSIAARCRRGLWKSPWWPEYTISKRPACRRSAFFFHIL